LRFGSQRSLRYTYATMMHSTMKHIPVPLVLAFLGVTAAHAASAPTPPATLVVCSRIADPGERVKCYDTQMAAMQAAASAPSTSPPAAAVVPKTEGAAAPASPAPLAAAPAAAPTADQKFGADDLPRAAREKVVKPDKSLVSTIASIRQLRPMHWVIVLGNGQTWLQDGTQITMFFRPGYDVRIEKGLLNDYRMSTIQTGPKNWVKVTRYQ
jgi:hypothetical protein